MTRHDVERPPYIKKRLFDAWLPERLLDVCVSIDGGAASGYIASRDKAGSHFPMRSINGERYLRLRDVLSAAGADGRSFEPASPPARRQVAKAVTKTKLSLDMVSVSVIGKPLLTEDAIAARREMLPSVCGVYFLLMGSRVVYVGQSRQMITRISEHMRSNKVFDGWSYITCEQSQLDIIESLYIHFLKPPLNGGSANNGWVPAPLRLSDIDGI